MECGGCYSQTNNAAHGHTPPQDTQVLSKAFGKLALLDIAYGDAATPPLGSSLLQVRCGLLTLQVHLHTQLPLLLNHYFRSKQLGAALLVAVEACHRRPKQSTAGPVLLPLLALVVPFAPVASGAGTCEPACLERVCGDYTKMMAGSHGTSAEYKASANLFTEGCRVNRQSTFSSKFEGPLTCPPRAICKCCDGETSPLGEGGSEQIQWTPVVASSESGDTTSAIAASKAKHTSNLASMKQKKTEVEQAKAVSDRGCKALAAWNQACPAMEKPTAAYLRDIIALKGEMPASVMSQYHLTQKPLEGDSVGDKGRCFCLNTPVFPIVPAEPDKVPAGESFKCPQVPPNNISPPPIPPSKCDPLETTKAKCIALSSAGTDTECPAFQGAAGVAKAFEYRDSVNEVAAAWNEVVAKDDLVVDQMNAHIEELTNIARNALAAVNMRSKVANAQQTIAKAQSQAIGQIDFMKDKLLSRKAVFGAFVSAQDLGLPKSTNAVIRDAGMIDDKCDLKTPSDDFTGGESARKAGVTLNAPSTTAVGQLAEFDNAAVLRSNALATMGSVPKLEGSLNAMEQSASQCTVCEMYTCLLTKLWRQTLYKTVSEYRTIKTICPKKAGEIDPACKIDFSKQDDMNKILAAMETSFTGQFLGDNSAKLRDEFCDAVGLQEFHGNKCPAFLDDLLAYTSTTQLMTRVATGCLVPGSKEGDYFQHKTPKSSPGPTCCGYNSLCHVLPRGKSAYCTDCIRKESNRGEVSGQIGIPTNSKCEAQGESRLKKFVPKLVKDCETTNMMKDMMLTVPKSRKDDLDQAIANLQLEADDLKSAALGKLADAGTKKPAFDALTATFKTKRGEAGAQLSDIMSKVDSAHIMETQLKSELSAAQSSDKCLFTQPEDACVCAKFTGSNDKQTAFKPLKGYDHVLSAAFPELPAFSLSDVPPPAQLKGPSSDVPQAIQRTMALCAKEIFGSDGKGFPVGDSCIRQNKGCGQKGAELNNAWADEDAAVYSNENARKAQLAAYIAYLTQVNAYLDAYLEEANAAIEGLDQGIKQAFSSTVVGEWMRIEQEKLLAFEESVAGLQGQISTSKEDRMSELPGAMEETFSQFSSGYVKKLSKQLATPCGSIYKCANGDKDCSNDNAAATNVKGTFMFSKKDVQQGATVQCKNDGALVYKDKSFKWFTWPKKQSCKGKYDGGITKKLKIIEVQDGGEVLFERPDGHDEGECRYGTPANPNKKVCKLNNMQLFNTRSYFEADGVKWMEAGKSDKLKEHVWGPCVSGPSVPAGFNADDSTASATIAQIDSKLKAAITRIAASGAKCPME